MTKKVKEIGTNGRQGLLAEFYVVHVVHRWLCFDVYCERLRVSVALAVYRYLVY